MATKTSRASNDAILVKNLHKSYDKLKVLTGVDLRVKRGTILALLGPNGAGKTTTIKILSTLLRADKGTATINGYDVVEQAGKVRSSIGLTGQYAAVDEYLTGRENLVMIGRLYRMTKDEASERAEDFLKRFDLLDAANRTVKTYSGGMRRRIDLAMSLIAEPPIIFLDEPTTGLDPRSRQTMWQIIEQLAEEGTTILLTTQYMEEADHLADNIIVIDHGKVIAEGTSRELKSQVGSDRLEVKVANKASFEAASKLLSGKETQIDKDNQVISLATKDGVSELRQVLQRLADKKIDVDSVNLRQPTLDDVFLSLTGHGATEAEEQADAKGAKNG